MMHQKSTIYIAVGVCMFIIVLLYNSGVTPVSHFKVLFVNNHGRMSPDRSVEVKTWKWTDVFEFVPNGIRICTELFPMRKELPPPFQIKFDEFIKYTKRFKITEGFSAMHIEELLTYFRLAQAPFIKTVCETGFNAGHSAFIWLAVNHNTRVYSFDIGHHPYSRPLARYLSNRFQNRLNITWGDSFKTLPLFHEMHPDVKCDLIIVDGGHTNKVCKSDMNTFMKMANPDNIVLLDNYPDMRLNWMQQLGDVWEAAKQNGELLEIFNCRFPYNNPQGFSVGRFLKPKTKTTIN